MRFRIVIRGKGDWPKEIFWLVFKSTLIFIVVYSVVSGMRGCAVERWKHGRTINEESSARTPAHIILI